MKLTVEEIYDRLVNDDKILTKKGRITFTLGDIDIIVRQRDVVGNIVSILFSATTILSAVFQPIK